MIIGSESETVEFKLTTGEKNAAVEAMGSIRIWDTGVSETPWNMITISKSMINEFS